MRNAEGEVGWSSADGRESLGGKIEGRGVCESGGKDEGLEEAKGYVCAAGLLSVEDVGGGVGDDLGGIASKDRECAGLAKEAAGDLREPSVSSDRAVRAGDTVVVVVEEGTCTLICWPGRTTRNPRASAT